VTGGLAAPLLNPVMRSRMMRDLIARLVAYAVALVLLATAFGFLVATLYLALAEVVEAPLAALLTALALGGVAGLILLRARYRRPRKPAAGTVGADALLLSISEQVRRDPWPTLATAAVLGALAEISHSSSNRPPT
jgi:divalent metal cation (Fe/Co/Zn/Cd) transporter